MPLKKQKTFKNSKGFTLIELMLVLSIMTLMASILLVSFKNARVKGRDAKRIADMKQFSTAMELYYADFHNYPNCSDVGYNGSPSGGCDLTNYPNPGDNSDSSADGKFIQFLKPYVKTIPVDPTNSSTSGLIYVYATGQSHGGTLYAYAIGAFLEEPNNPILKSSITYGDPSYPTNLYAVGQVQ